MGLCVPGWDFLWLRVHAKGRKASDGEDEFAIGRHESVVRQVLLHGYAAEGFRKNFGQTFWVQMTLEE